MNPLPQAKKALGQHFLKDPKTISLITADWAHDCDIIVEVGPGPAVLTKHLAKIDRPLFVIEKDKSFEPYLLEHLGQDYLYFDDALKFNWQSFIDANKLRGKKIWLVSNLPYNVGTALFTQFLQIQEIEYMTLMFQKEVGDKTFIQQKKNQMNGLLFLTLNYFNSKRLCKVSPGCFRPPPKVDSVVVSYQRKKTPDICISNFKKLNSFTRLLFGLRRKQIHSVLKQNYPQDQLQALFSKIQAPKEQRAEALSYQDVLEIFSNLE